VEAGAADGARPVYSAPVADFIRHIGLYPDSVFVVDFRFTVD
jgi:hypothetical protein